MPRRTAWWPRAAAEFMVIVVGVLVALAVDSWNAGRADRRLEQTYLGSLADELRFTSVALTDGFLPSYEAKLESLTTIAGFVRGEAELPSDTLAFLLDVSLAGRGGATTFEFPDATYRELQTTGNLRLIESATLRTSIVSYYTWLDRLLEGWTARMAGYPAFVHQYLPSELREDWSKANVRSFGVQRTLAALRTDEFERTMNVEFNLAYWLIRNLQEVRDRTNTLLDQVDAERDR